MDSLASTILTDCLGITQARAQIEPRTEHQRGVHISAEPIIGYRVCSTVDVLGGREFADADGGLQWAMNNGFEIEERRDGYGRTYWQLTHTATRQEQERRAAVHDTKWGDAEDCYVRYGDLPANGRSTNHADGRLERGVSVFHGKYRPDLQEAIAIPEHNQELGSWLMLQSRVLYVVDGTLIGYGSDGEPVLAECCVVTQINRG